MNKIPMTADGYKKLQNELKKLTSEDRPKIIEAIAEARSHGDLSENAEYQYAKEQQSLIEGRIIDLESAISKSEVIDVKSVEGDDINKGIVDVVVTDGFSGNIALKTAEGVADLIFTYLKNAYQSSFVSKLGYILSKPALNRFKTRIDPRKYNGAVLLGLNGIIVKSHGGTDAFGFSNAISVAISLIKNNYVNTIENKLTGKHE